MRYMAISLDNILIIFLIITVHVPEYINNKNNYLLNFSNASIIHRMTVFHPAIRCYLPFEGPAMPYIIKNVFFQKIQVNENRAHLPLFHSRQ